MNKCKNCRASKLVCEYCIYKNGNDSQENKDNENVIYFKNIKYDNTSKKICPICKKVFTGYPAISRKDNRTLICSDCGMKEVEEPFESLLNDYENRF